MPAVSSSLEKIPQNPPISPALRPETIRHPDKRSKLENDATCGLGEQLGRYASRKLAKRGVEIVSGASELVSNDAGEVHWQTYPEMPRGGANPFTVNGFQTVAHHAN